MRKNKNPQVISTKKTLQSTLFHINQLTIKMPQGKLRTHDVVFRDPTVSVFPVTDTNELYMVKQYRYLHKKVTLEAMAGFIDQGEDPLVAAKRELQEETGLKAKNWKELTNVEVAASVVKGTNYLFLARDLTQGEVNQDEDEDIEVVKIPLDEALKKTQNGEINHAASMIGILLLSRIKSTIII